MIKKSTQHTFTKSNNTRISTSHSRCHVPLLTCTGTHTRKAECTLFNKNRFWPPQLFRSVHAHPHQIQLHLKFQAIRGKIKEEKNWSSLTGKLLSLVSPNNNNRGKNKKKAKNFITHWSSSRLFYYMETNEVSEEWILEKLSLTSPSISKTTLQEVQSPRQPLVYKGLWHI